jgi:hypothetical protein
MVEQSSFQGETNLRDVINWKNTSAETVPPFGVVQVKTYHVDGYFEIVKPTATGRVFYLNGPASVQAGKFGSSFIWTRPQIGLATLLHTGEHIGSNVGPVDGEWELTSAGAGFRLITDVDATVKVGMVEPAPRELVVILDEDIDSAGNSREGENGRATVQWWNPDNNRFEPLEDTTGRETPYAIDVEVWNHSESTDHLEDTFGEAKFKHDHFWFFGDCDPMAVRPVPPEI